MSISPLQLPKRLSISSSPQENANYLLNTPLFRPRKLSSPLLSTTLQDFDKNDEHRERFDRIISIKLKNALEDTTLIKDVHPILNEVIMGQNNLTSILGLVFTHKDFTDDIKSTICKQYRNLLNSLVVFTKNEGIFIANEYAMTFEFEFHQE